MNRTERQIICDVINGLNAVPSVRNPMDTQGIAEYHFEMQKVRGLLCSTLTHLLYSPEQSEIEEAKENLKELNLFIESRKPVWDKPREGPEIRFEEDEKDAHS